MNFRKRLKQKRSNWARMARANCRLFGLPFKTYLTWDELPDGHQVLPEYRDIMWKAIHCGYGLMLINPCVKESDFTPINIKEF